MALPDDVVTESGDGAPETGASETATSERHDVTPEPPTPEAKPGQGAAPKANAPTIPPPPAVDYPIELRVFHVVTGAEIAPFQWRFVTRGNLIRGDSDTATAKISVPRTVQGNLLVEADGMQPFEQKNLQAPAPGEPMQRIDVFLTPKATGQGITLMVKTLDRQPVRNVRVDCYQLLADKDPKEQTGWDLGQSLWSRRTSQADGTYELPPLSPGNYGIVLVATDAEGNVLPLSSYRQTFALTGSNGFLEDVPLEPACALILDLQDGQGRPYDPKVYGKTSLSLNVAGQTGIQRKWTAANEAGGMLSEANAAPAKGKVWLDQPIPPGNYLLEIFVDGDPRVSQPLLLRPEQQTQTIYIR